ncbi:MBL fold metallo-hydrolase [Sediminicola luteus]|uniref:Metallo-beta-lactamase domain-containing protein n=1 Tax=Sediminicola luteus TaxID=319238 RepID=A0A2A4GF99_9FLAO|nr:MBL fold metallo-hydrolase [Sediminicola luteus]PCE66668.1 hypothetical protein B7P33_05075 [Sediminicola luteus]
MRTIRLIIVLLLLWGMPAKAQTIGGTLPPWQEGYLDIHHLSTGRGDCAYAVFPDGTSLLIDAGDTSDTHPRTVSERNTPRMPNADKSVSEWIVGYIQQFAPKKEKPELDYALITHYHDDHFGELDALRPRANDGDYALTGIMGVGHGIPIKTLIDRGYEYPLNLKDPEVQKRFGGDKFGMIPTLKELWKFTDYHAKNGLEHETLIAGSDTQIAMRYRPEAFPEFSVRNIAVNGQIWTGEGEKTYALFKSGDYPGENPLSSCIKISYGAFDYFTGGDIGGIDGLGQTDFNSVESHIAPVVGPVDVATLNHHGNRDSQNPFYVRSLRPRIWVQQLWSSDHPGEEVLRRILSTQTYPGPRDVFSTAMLTPNKLVIGGKLDRYKSQQGHILIRVVPGGSQYWVYILNDRNPKREITKIFGPYGSR